MNDQVQRLTLKLKYRWNTGFVQCDRQWVHSDLMRLGQIGCRRQNPPIQSAEPADQQTFFYTFKGLVFCNSMKVHGINIRDQINISYLDHTKNLSKSIQLV
ncbi:Hypothetical_protein [Hexamita inflata]|uniref:Hypothetical_protein n=1 Tax=Hexamita inflata TaxID=28002 RepID=A0AA86RW56_9EUKA|nr:Hypothetical protein HINF_LOCUS66594 [Hexamita inflata]